MSMAVGRVLPCQPSAVIGLKSTTLQQMKWCGIMGHLVSIALMESRSLHQEGKNSVLLTHSLVNISKLHQLILRVIFTFGSMQW